MPAFQFVPSIRDSETVTCGRCNTRQYPNGACVRCRSALGVVYLSLPMSTLLTPQTQDPKKHLACWIGVLLRLLRKRRGIHQSQLASMSPGIDRSYLSKAETGFALLPLTSLLPLLHSLGLTTVILRFEDCGLRAKPKSSQPR
jgi:hypothetical protein